MRPDVPAIRTLDDNELTATCGGVKDWFQLGDSGFSVPLGTKLLVGGQEDGLVVKVRKNGNGIKVVGKP